MTAFRKLALGALSACAMVALPGTSHAARIQLGFALDESGSISGTEWNIIRNGLSSAITLIPVTGADSYFLSVVTFDDNANARISNVQVTAANRATLASTVAGMAQGAGSTNYEAGFRGLNAAMGDESTFDFSYVNFATDGEPNTCGYPNGTSANLAAAQTCGIAARDAMLTAGVDNISIEGIGVSASNATFLQNSICSPQPCDTTQPFNFPAQGFYIGVANATQYAAAIGNKVRVVTGQTPEPGSVALAGLALAALALSQRKKTVG